MKEWILGILANKVGLDLAIMIAGVYATNVALVGFQKGLEFIKDKTASNVDNKAYEVIGKVSGILMKIIDVVGFNPKH